MSAFNVFPRSPHAREASQTCLELAQKPICENRGLQRANWCAIIISQGVKMTGRGHKSHFPSQMTSSLLETPAVAEDIHPLRILQEIADLTGIFISLECC